jgi:hypothetical protein
MILYYLVTKLYSTHTGGPNRCTRKPESAFILNRMVFIFDRNMHEGLIVRAWIGEDGGTAEFGKNRTLS